MSPKRSVIVPSNAADSPHNHKITLRTQRTFREIAACQNDPGGTQTDLKCKNAEQAELAVELKRNDARIGVVGDARN